MALLFAGTISGIRGIKGEMLVKKVPPDFEFIPSGTKINIGYSINFSHQYRLINWSIYPKGAILLIEGINTDLKAKELLEQGIFIDESIINSDNSESYYLEEIIGCNVYNEDNNEYLGKITDVWLMPANDVWVLETPNGNIPLPYIDDVIKSVDTNNKTIKINLIPGLLDLMENFDNKKEEV